MIPALEELREAAEQVVRSRLSADAGPRLSVGDFYQLIHAAITAAGEGDAAESPVAEAEQVCYVAGLLAHAGHRVDAQQLLRSCANTAAVPVARSRYRNVLGMLLVDAGRYREADQSFRDALIDVGVSDAAYSSTIAANLVTVAQLQGRADQVDRWARVTVGAEDAGVRLATAVTLTSRAALAGDLYQANDLNLAVAFAATRLVAGTGSRLEQARIVAQAAAVTFQDNRLRAHLDGMRSAAGVLQRCAELIAAHLGEHHAEVLALSALAAGCELDIGRMERSAEGVENAVARLRACGDRFTDHLGATHPKTVVVRADEALAAAEAGRLTGSVPRMREASAWLEESYARLRPLLGEEHPACITILANRATVEFDIARVEESAAGVQRTAGLLGEARRLAAAGLGDDHPLTIVIEGQLRTCRALEGTGWGGLDTGPDALAAEYLPSADAARWAASAGETPAEFHAPSALYEVSEAINALIEAEEQFGPASRQALVARGDVAYWTGHAGERIRSIELYTQVLEDQRALFGDADADTLRTLSNLSYWYGHAGDLASALDGFQLLVETRTRTLGEMHPDTVLAWHNLAVFTAATGDYANAVSLMRYVVNLRSELFGPTGPETMNSRRRLQAWTEPV